jgi:hypothetical protein
MENKPVAWMWENDAWIGVNNFSEEKPSAYPNAIPLYTAPRELSDEEIKTLHDETSWWGVTDPVKFARAILKKASEK